MKPPRLIILLAFILCCSVVGGYAQQPGKATFNIDSVPFSNAKLDSFPYIALPKGTKLLNDKPFEHQEDLLFFPIDGEMQKKEGRVWRAFITQDAASGNGWSNNYYTKSIAAAITKLGGVRVFQGKVTRAAVERIKEMATYFGDEGSIDYWNEPVSVYVIRRRDGHHVWIQFSGYSAGGQLQVLQQ
jgi:hypothetical protein